MKSNEKVCVCVCVCDLRASLYSIFKKIHGGSPKGFATSQFNVKKKTPDHPNMLFSIDFLQRSAQFIKEMIYFYGSFSNHSSQNKHLCTVFIHLK